MAGLWEVWEDDDRRLLSVTILTTEPNDLMEPIHDRMNVVLPDGTEDRWLSGDSAEREELCNPYPEDDMAAYEISNLINDPGNNRLEVIEELGHEQSGFSEF